MPSLREHLDSPQFTDENGESTGESVLARIGGSWVKPGVPRGRGYLFFAIVVLAGLFFIGTSGSDFDLFAFFGVVCVVLGIVGVVEIARGRPFSGILGR
jgi:hypothetical protein